jgi:hypothetical protein
METSIAESQRFSNCNDAFGYFCRQLTTPG